MIPSRPSLTAAFCLIVAPPLTAQDLRPNYERAAAIQAAGGRVTVGAHGELQGLGVHWELWAMGGEGALSPHDALRAATLEGARYIGIDGDVGSLEPGKLADVLVVRGNPLEDLRATAEVAWVLKNGEVVVEGVCLPHVWVWRGGVCCGGEAVEDGGHVYLSEGEGDYL